MNSAAYDTRIAAAVAAAAAKVAATKAAGTKEKALGVEAMQDPDAGIGGSVADGETTTYSMTISRDRDGTEIEIADTANAGDDDPKFAQAMDLGEGRTMHVRAMEADDDGNVVEEVVIVMTDIAAPKATAFAMVAGQALNARDLDDAEDADGDGNDSNDFTALTVEAGTDNVNLPKIMASAFTAGTQAELTFDSNDTTTEDEDESFEVAGTYNGAAGTYRCNGNADCTVNINTMGKISEIGTGWIFTPDKGATSDVPDADYLNYGFWLKKTTDADGATNYDEVETFAGSSVGESSTGSELNDVEGSATYNGNAVGVYVKSVSKPDGKRASATSGHFLADATLTANFSGTSIAEDIHNTVTGMITNFMLSGEEENSWSVALKGAREDNENTISGTANGGGAEGMFSGTFYGLTPETADTEDGDARVAPGSVVGEFNAGFSNGSVAGGFGARKE